ncbi:zinc finger protein 91-like isoform X2 [Schistocerca serialis cubense]|uniref:zinc finger protein 91-like isoform X2 n=2 Tax=Schistocerca serialis cubense TaxID=2023355 RepID=UPI00214EEFA8|nr:zinc finger protein 91-like isoform X2 [Schistocerca serialis cubense]
MDQEPTMWIKKEGTDEVQTELCFMAQVSPISMNVKEELEEGAKEESVRDPLGISWSTDFIKEDPELNLEMNVTENIVETSTRYPSDSARLTQSTGGRCGICEETCHHRLVQDEFVIDMEKSTHEFGTHTGDVTVDKECSVATQYDCSAREKELHVYSCNFCQQGFPSKYRLIKHVFMHTDGMQPPLYVCKWCCEIFDSKFSLKKHLRMSENYHVLTAGIHEKYGYSDEHQSSILLDSLPEVSVTERNVWSSYKETWKPSKKSSNDMCNTPMGNDADKISDYGTSSTAVNVRAQGDLLTANSTDKCGMCGKLSGRSGHPKREKLLDTGKKPHKCEIRGESFSQSGHLKTEELIRTGKKPHKCKICGRCFARSSNLKRHELIHTGNKPHKCVICDKSFAQSGSLKIHNLIHTGKKPHKCEICGNSFARAVYLETHILIHTGKKPHKCKSCGRCFARSSNLKRHKLIHTGNKPHKCEICGKSFARSGYLKKHIKSHWKETWQMCDL